MRKKCVLWAKPVLVTLAIILVAGLRWSDGTLSAQSTDPLTLPRLSFSDFTYQGGFRLPATPQGGDFSYGGSHIAFNPARNSLFVSSLHNKVAEVLIPAPANTSDVTQMPFASYLQSFSDPAEGHLQDIGYGTLLGGLLVQNNKLYATGWIYYDGLNTQVLSHFARSTNLSEPSFSGLAQVWDTSKAGYVGGYMAHVPSEWQPLLGGPALTGQCCIPIVTRTSFGPAAFGFDPAAITGGASVPAAPLLYYTKEHATLGPWEGSSEMYGAATMMGGAVVIPGTRTALFIGRIGTGEYCYGHGVTDPALHNTKAADGQTNCYDPANAAKGTHAYPYRYQMWAYDLADFAAVKAGAKQPWDVVPYNIYPFDFPTPEKTVQVGGVAYDAQRQLLYVAQMFADVDGCCERRPIIHALKVNAPSSTAPPPLSTTVSLTPNLVAPQAPGTLIKWSAAAFGNQGPYEYKWSAYANGAWSVVRDWSGSPTAEWQPAAAAEDARMAVWVRTAPGSLAAGAVSADATAEFPFRIAAAAQDSSSDTSSTSTPVSSLALTTNVAAPQAVGSTIVWTATPTGGSGDQVYKWFVTENGVSWNAIGTWSASNQFTWTPSTASANYRVSAWVKRASSTKDEWEASAERAFAITGTGSVVTDEPVSTPTSTPVSSLALTSSVASPQPAGSTIVWTATPTGGSGAQLYKWFVTENGVTWNAIGTWSESNQFTWTPAVAGTNYRISTWVKRAISTKDEWEATTEQAFVITEAGTVSKPAPRPTPKPTPVSAPATVSGPAVTVTSTSVQPGQTIEFSVSGGPANRLDWVSLSLVSAADTNYVRWMYLNGTATTPATGMSSATLQFKAPGAPGNYNIRFFADNGYTKLATSATIVVGAANTNATATSTASAETTTSATTSASATGPAVTVAATTVQAGSPIAFTVSGGPAGQLDWVSLSAASAADTVYSRWMYLSGTTTKPATGTSGATLQFTAPTTPGSYNIRFFAANGYTKLATSATITVSATVTTGVSVTGSPATAPAVSVDATTVKPGAAIPFTVSGGPANQLDWVSIAPATAADNSYVRWMYLSGSTAAPATAVAGASLQFIAPAAAGTYNIRFFSNNGFTKLASSATVTVAP